MDFKLYRLYEQGAGPGRRVVKLVTRSQGERMVRSKTAQQGLDWDGVTLCFQLIDTRASGAVPTYQEKNKGSFSNLSIDEMPAEISSAAFSQPEMMAIAGTKFRHGRSRTARMSEQQRRARVQRIYDDGVLRNGSTIRGIKVKPEDLVERATNKFRAWQQIPVLMDRFREV